MAGMELLLPLSRLMIVHHTDGVKHKSDWFRDKIKCKFTTSPGMKNATNTGASRENSEQAL